MLRGVGVGVGEGGRDTKGEFLDEVEEEELRGVEGLVESCGGFGMGFCGRACWLRKSRRLEMVLWLS